MRGAGLRFEGFGRKRREDALHRQEREREIKRDASHRRILRFNSFVAAMAAVVALASALISYHQWLGAKAQLEVMRRQLDVAEANKRPWVGVDVDAASLRPVSHDNWALQMRVRLRNGGESAARNIDVAFTVDSPRNQAFDSPTQKALCERATKNSRNKARSGITLLPREENEQSTSLGIQPSKLDPWPSSKRIAFVVLGCVAYTYSDDRQGVTGLRHIVSERVESSGSHARGIDFSNGALLLPPKLAFDRDMVGNFAE